MGVIGFERGVGERERGGFGWMAWVDGACGMYGALSWDIYFFSGRKKEKGGFEGWVQGCVGVRRRMGMEREMRECLVVVVVLVICVRGSFHSF